MVFESLEANLMEEKLVHPRRSVRMQKIDSQSPTPAPQSSKDLFCFEPIQTEKGRAFSAEPAVFSRSYDHSISNFLKLVLQGSAHRGGELFSIRHFLDLPSLLGCRRALGEESCIS